MAGSACDSSSASPPPAMASRSAAVVGHPLDTGQVVRRRAGRPGGSRRRTRAAMSGGSGSRTRSRPVSTLRSARCASVRRPIYLYHPATDASAGRRCGFRHDPPRRDPPCLAAILAGWHRMGSSTAWRSSRAEDRRRSLSRSCAARRGLGANGGDGIPGAGRGHRSRGNVLRRTSARRRRLRARGPRLAARVRPDGARRFRCTPRTRIARGFRIESSPH